GPQCLSRREIQAQIFVALQIQEDYVPAANARVCMLANCILTRHLNPPSRPTGIEVVEVRGGSARVSAGPRRCMSMWLFLDQRRPEFQLAAWRALRLLRGRTELDDHDHSPEVV